MSSRFSYEGGMTEGCEAFSKGRLNSGEDVIPVAFERLACITRCQKPMTEWPVASQVLFHCSAFDILMVQRDMRDPC